MAKRKTYTVGGITFPTKQALVSHARCIRDSYKDYENLNEDDFRFMLAYIHAIHNDPKEKIGLGVRRMWVQKHEEYPHRGFKLERVDGTATDFSFIPYKKTFWSEFCKACREAVRPDMIKFRHVCFQNNATDGKLKCSVSEQLIEISESHVDHIPPYTFESLARSFIDEKALDIATVKFGGGDNVLGTFFLDQTLRDSWVAYHRANAHLRVIRGYDNLSTVKKS